MIHLSTFTFSKMFGTKFFKLLSFTFKKFRIKVKITFVVNPV